MPPFLSSCTVWNDSPLFSCCVSGCQFRASGLFLGCECCSCHDQARQRSQRLFSLMGHSRRLIDIAFSPYSSSASWVRHSAARSEAVYHRVEWQVPFPSASCRTFMMHKCQLQLASLSTSNPGVGLEPSELRSWKLLERSNSAFRGSPAFRKNTAAEIMLRCEV